MVLINLSNIVYLQNILNMPKLVRIRSEYREPPVSIGHSLLRVLKARDELGIFFFLRKWNSIHWD